MLLSLRISPALGELATDLSNDTMELLLLYFSSSAARGKDKSQHKATKEVMIFALVRAIMACPTKVANGALHQTTES